MYVHTIYTKLALHTQDMVQAVEQSMSRTGKKVAEEKWYSKASTLGVHTPHEILSLFANEPNKDTIAVRVYSSSHTRVVCQVIM